MLNPFTAVRHPWLVVGLAAAAAAVIAVPLLRLNEQLSTCGTRAPKGIASLELARDGAAAQAILDDWRRCGVLGTARRSIALDCLFVPAYSTLLAFLLFAAAAWLEPRARLPSLVAGAWGWAMWGAGLLDYVENWCDWRMLERGATDTLAAVSSTAATIKFVVTVVMIQALR